MLTRFLAGLADRSRRHAVVLVAAMFIATVLLAVYAATHLSIDTNTSHMFPRSLHWRQMEIAYDRAFPQDRDLLVVVIEADAPYEAAQAANRLAARLRKDARWIKSVRQPDGGKFFSRNGLLYLPLQTLRKMSAEITREQPLLGALSADPSLHGLFTVLGQAVAAQASGRIAAGELRGPLEMVAGTVNSVLEGHPRPLSWAGLLTGTPPSADQRRRFILVQPVLDYAALSPGAKATGAVRRAAEALGLTEAHGVQVHLTGSVALDDAEFATVAQGMGLAAGLSLTLVTVLLLMAVRSPRLVLCILLTLIAGIVFTAAFAAAAVGSLNLISIAFVVLFVGIAVDFGIQFSMRYREEHWRWRNPARALRRSAATVGRALGLAAIATAIGFFALLPTNYRGMAELGLIAGVGMLIALLLNLTLLPALISLTDPPPDHRAPGYAWAAGLDRWLLTHRRTVAVLALATGLAGLTMLPFIRIDFDPLNLQDQQTDAMRTLKELAGSPSATPFTIDALTPSLHAAKRLATRLEALPEVSKAISLASFVPEHQKQKLALIDDLSLLLGPAPTMLAAADPTPARTLQALRRLEGRLAGIRAGTPLHPVAQRLAKDLRRLEPRFAHLAAPLEHALMGGFVPQVKSLYEALEAAPVTLESLPASLRSDWIATDGRFRVEVFPKGDAQRSSVLTRFARAVLAIAPDATGAPVSILASGRTVLHAFIIAGLVALLAITALLTLVLRRARDVLLVLAPLTLAGLLTVVVAIGAGLALNFANIIALPLLFGIGVSFSIYFVINWRNGVHSPLQSATARAVLFSALTTGSAFGSLALSNHPGTASMGILLGISLACTLFCTLLVQPALLGPPRTSRPRGAQSA